MARSIDEFVTPLREALREESCLSLVLAAPLRRTGEIPRKQTVRPVTLQGRPLYQWELQFERQQTQQNLSAEQTLQRVRELFGTQYREAYLFTREEDLLARASSRGVRIQRRPPSRSGAETPQAHDRRKQYLIAEGIPCPFLEALEVMTPGGRVRKAKQRKFRQINRYLELVNDVYPSLPAEGGLRVVDFGCGLSYLTFAVHHLLAGIHERETDLHGIDQNPHVISRCRALAAGLELKGIRFSEGTIDAVPAEERIHLAISLHACDTATDQALAYGVRAGAEAILAAPCCQHELFTRLNAPEVELISRHGVLKERFAALATDALRAAALEAAGYRAQVLEFIDLEHTPKNLLIRAVRRPAGTFDSPAMEEYRRMKEFLRVDELATDAVCEAVRNVES